MPCPADTTQSTWFEFESAVQAWRQHCYQHNCRCIPAALLRSSSMRQLQHHPFMRTQTSNCSRRLSSIFVCLLPALALTTVCLLRCAPCPAELLCVWAHAAAVDCYFCAAGSGAGLQRHTRQRGAVVQVSRPAAAAAAVCARNLLFQQSGSLRLDGCGPALLLLLAPAAAASKTDGW